MRCPRCQSKLTYHRPIDAMYCWTCGHQQPAPTEERQQHVRQKRGEITPPQRPARQHQPPIPMQLPKRLDMSQLKELENDYEYVRLRGRCFEAMHALSGGDKAASRAALKKILEINDGYADAWLHLAGLADDAATQRAYLERVLASQPTHQRALQTLLLLNERDRSGQPTQREPRLEPGQAAAQQLKCPQCGGGLGYRSHDQQVFCRNCGYEVISSDDLTRTDTTSTVTQGLVKRKLAGKRWNIGGRWLRCAECGATTTLSRQTLTSTCRFCHSQQVVQESANHVFEQPDLIVPFVSNEQDANAAVEQHLRSGIRMITRFFTDAVRRIALQAVYLPYWVFDADMIVNYSWTRAPGRNQYPVLLNDVLWFAGTTPPHKLAHKIEPFNIRLGVDYDPRLLAAHPAELYSVEMARASLDVRRSLGKKAIRYAEPSLRLQKPPRGYGANSLGGAGLFEVTLGGPSGWSDSDDPGRLQMHATTQFLTYRLALLPVWIGVLEEEDGDTRQVIVNGQTGSVALGELQKAPPRSFQRQQSQARQRTISRNQKTGRLS